MTHALTYGHAARSDDFYPSHATSWETQSVIQSEQSHATSREAQSVAQRIRKCLDGGSIEPSISGPAMMELADTFLDCREEGWDGYGALPVKDSSFLRAQAFLSPLMLRFPPPTAGATPHGSLTLEWSVNQRRRMMVCVGDDEQIAYAAVDGDQTAQGVTSFFQDVPQEISSQLSRLYFTPG
jgi:hypothetical protein